MDILIEEYESSIWAIALEQGRIDGLEIDPPNEHVRWGSIYWAKVARIDTGLDAAFLDLDGDNTGILYNRDVRFQDKDGKVQKGGEKAIGKILKAGDMIAVQAKSAYLTSTDDDVWNREDKTPQMSMDITIQGRYLVYCTLLQKNGLSQRIRGKERRKQLEDMLVSLDDMYGFILRSAAADLQTEILYREAKILKHMWEQISEFFTGNDPSLIALGPDSIQRTLSDKAKDPIERIEVVTMDHFSQVEDWCDIFAPDLMTKITPLELEDATQDLALLEYRDLLGQIEALFQEYALLTHGGNVIIQQTAALTAIDVNKGSDKRSNLALNIEAAEEIARQMRLRNIGGIVVVDFLKMNKKDEKALLKALDDETYEDPCTVQVHGVTKLGLIEITRKRRTPALIDRFEGIAF
ncbi:MAG: ribonuclease E/G [Alphaproteobacteria bacterium]